MDARNLPEMQQLMVDFALPVLPPTSGETEYSVANGRRVPDSTMNLSPRQAPQVHVFLVQESMGADALAAVIEGISRTVEEMHDDSHLVLATYSNRIGIHRCLLDGLSGPSSQPVVQYAHFHVSEASNGIFDLWHRFWSVFDFLHRCCRVMKLSSLTCLCKFF